jgi:Ser/Thr protein kinase RdoA (MazF antagonist)
VIGISLDAVHSQIRISDDELDRWCRRWLGEALNHRLFELAHLSTTVGLRLADNRDVVVKVREPAERLQACVAVQAHLWAAGFPCPQPLAGPAPLGALVATAETFVDGGMPLERTAAAARLYAEALGWLVRLAPPVSALSTLEPPPAWVWWDHHQPGTWPEPDDMVADLNARPGPTWVDEVGRRALNRLRLFDAPAIVGHCDWWSQNLRWIDERLYVVHDWDSVAARSEAVIAGVAAAIFCTSRTPGSAPSIEDTDAFLSAYEGGRGLRWTGDEREVCWAAGLWSRAFDVRKAAETHGAEEFETLRCEAPERLRRAGA